MTDITVDLKVTVTDATGTKKVQHLQLETINTGDNPKFLPQEIEGAIGAVAESLVQTFEHHYGYRTDTAALTPGASK